MAKSENDWEVREVRAYAPFFRGQRWPCQPRIDRASAEAYADRLGERWDPGTAQLLIDQEGQKLAVWKATWSPGKGAPSRVEQIKAERLDDAKQILRDMLACQRLPNGIEWEQIA